ncbi:hypothetical protein BDW62DRAFT_180696 [Aspergillus aurantiobrunneus]
MVVSVDFVSGVAGPSETCELPISVMVELLSVLVEPPRTLPKIPLTKPPSSSVVVDDAVLVSVAGFESLVAVALTCATVDCSVVVDAAPVPVGAFALPVMVCVMPFSSTETVMGTTTTSGSGSLDVVVAVVSGAGCSESWLKSEPSQPKFEFSPLERPNCRLSCLWS